MCWLQILMQNQMLIPLVNEYKCHWHAFKAVINAYVLIMSTGWAGSGLCPTRNRPAYVGWTAERPVADRRRLRVESNWTPSNNGRIDRVYAELQSPEFRQIEVQKHHIKPRFERKSPDLSKNGSKNITSSSDLSEKFISVTGSK